MARRKFEPTEQQRKLVTGMVAFGIPLLNVREFVINPESGRPISEHTLTRAFRAEIATAVDHANFTIANNLFRIASLKSESPQVVQAIIFWLRTRGGWKLADAAAPAAPPAADAPKMVGNEENARAIVEDVLNKYGRKRLTG